MSRFYASIQGSRSEATRQGTAFSGMVSHTRGWEFGVKVVMSACGGEDQAEIYLTSGSDDGPTYYLGVFTKEIAAEFTEHVREWFLERDEQDVAD